MEWGTRLEQVIGEAWAEKTGNIVEWPASTFIHPVHHFMRANVDGIVVGKNEGLEIKTASSDSGWGEDGTDEVPVYYMTQCMHYCAVMGWDRIHVAVLISGKDFRKYTIEADQGHIEALIETEVSWWKRYVDGRQEPPRTGSEYALIGNTTGNFREADLSIIDLVGQLKDVKSKIDELTEVKDAITEAVQRYIADADGITADGRPIATWKFNKPTKKFSPTALKEERPEVYEEFVREVPGPRVFRLK